MPIRRKLRNAKPKAAAVREVAPKLLTVDEFCRENRICAATFYNLRAAGKGPVIVKIGSRTLIAPEAAEVWRQKMQEPSLA